jgi:hypothetical protein
MTLLELVVGLVITGAMASIGAVTFSNVIEHRAVIIDATRDAERAAAVRETIRQWIASGSIQSQAQGIRLTVSGGTATFSRGQSGSFRMNVLQAPGSDAATVTGVTPAIATGDELRFRTSALLDLPSPNVSVRLFVDGDDNTPERGLTIEYQLNPTAPLYRRVLDSTIVQITVEYLDATTLRWVPDAEAAGIRRVAARLTLGMGEDVPTPALLQLPMLFVLPGAANALDAQTADEEASVLDAAGGIP